MNAVPCHPALRARIAERLQVLVDDGANAVGRQLGHVGTTVSRRGPDLTRWPVADVLVLAQQDAALRDALLRCLTGDTVPAGDAVRVIPELFAELTAGTQVEAKGLETLQDGRCTAAEAADLLALIEARRRREDEHLLPSLRAVAAGARMRS